MLNIITAIILCCFIVANLSSSDVSVLLRVEAIELPYIIDIIDDNITNIII
jgi:uncharacterized integral membrane protein